jgi:hypothetical protein
VICKRRRGIERRENLVAQIHGEWNGEYLVGKRGSVHKQTPVPLVRKSAFSEARILPFFGVPSEVRRAGFLGGFYGGIPDVGTKICDGDFFSAHALQQLAEDRVNRRGSRFNSPCARFAALDKSPYIDLETTVCILAVARSCSDLVAYAR